jgi:hypothetical protein
MCRLQHILAMAVERSHHFARSQVGPPLRQVEPVVVSYAPTSDGVGVGPVFGEQVSPIDYVAL